jgi:hypothetical protein
MVNSLSRIGRSDPEADMPHHLGARLGIVLTLAVPAIAGTGCAEVGLADPNDWEWPDAPYPPKPVAELPLEVERSGVLFRVSMAAEHDSDSLVVVSTLHMTNRRQGPVEVTIRKHCPVFLRAFDRPDSTEPVYDETRFHPADPVVCSTLGEEIILSPGSVEVRSSQRPLAQFYNRGVSPGTYYFAGRISSIIAKQPEQMDVFAGSLDLPCSD